MTVTNDNKIELLLNAAEEHGQCLVRPHNAHLMRALAYRANHAKRNPIYSPYRGIYVRQACWNGLSRTEQVHTWQKRFRRFIRNGCSTVILRLQFADGTYRTAFLTD